MILGIDFLRDSLSGSSIFIDGKKEIPIDSPEAEKILFENTEFFISIDTRTISKNEIFLALRGNNVDGHDFLYNKNL